MKITFEDIKGKVPTLVDFIHLQKKAFIIGAIIISPFLLALSIPIGTTLPNNNTESPLNEPLEKVTTLQQAAINSQMKEYELTKKPGFINKKEITQDVISYTYESPLLIRPNEIRTNSGVVIFERSLTPEDPKNPNFATVSAYKQKYGNPDRVIKGSKFYDIAASTYIYAKRGFAFIGNEFTDEVYEFHTFLPTNPDDYIANFGDDILTGDRVHPLGE